jgi:hypothetical protein
MNTRVNSICRSTTLATMWGCSRSVPQDTSVPHVDMNISFRGNMITPREGNMSTVVLSLMTVIRTLGHCYHNYRY